MGVAKAQADTDRALETFRAECRAWLRAHFPPALAARGASAPPARQTDDRDLRAWRTAMGAKGWATPTWPAEYGGGGLSPAQARVLADELAQMGAFNPLLFGMGVTMIGPTILDYGTDAQKRRHIPPIVRGEVQWCVGYSEPNAGSDLASLQTRAVDAGDHWTINGQKTWTSGAQDSDWCGLLARTDPGASKHHGISFMLIDMHQPGVVTRPIALISGASPFCETFLTDAVAPKDALLGALNGGWTVGKRLLQHERASQTGAARARIPPLHEIARRHLGVDDTGRLTDADLRARLARHEMEAQAHRLTLERAAVEAKDADGATNTASVLKNAATRVAQNRAELTLEILGHQGLGWTGEAFTADQVDAVRDWLWGKAMSIYGGSFEIQDNIIAKRILGLPDATPAP